MTNANMTNAEAVQGLKEAYKHFRANDKPSIGLDYSKELESISLAIASLEREMVSEKDIYEVILKHFGITEEEGLIVCKPKTQLDIEKAVKLESFLKWFMTQDLARAIHQLITRGEK